MANALTAAYARPANHGLLYGIQFAATFGVGSFATTVGGFLLARGGTRRCSWAWRLWPCWRACPWPRCLRSVKRTP